MGGTDALLGFDYQISYILYRVLLLAKENRNAVKSIKFESLTEEEEDFNIYWKDGITEFIQVKKRNEGYMWTASDIKDLMRHYLKNYTTVSKYVFITNGSANKDVAYLKKVLKEKNISNKKINKFIPEEYDENFFKKAILSVKLETLAFVSDDDYDVAKVLRQQIIYLLSGIGFYVKGNVIEIYNTLWKKIYDMSKKSVEIDIISIIDILNQCGVSIINNEYWLKFPIYSDFRGRKTEINNIEDFLNKTNKIVVKGISGIGKSYIISKVADNLNRKDKSVCWISMKSNMTYTKIITILGEFCQNALGIEQCKMQLKNLEIGNQVKLLLTILENKEGYIFIDSFDEAKEQVLFLIQEFFKKITKNFLTRVIIATTERKELYNDLDIKADKVIEYNVEEFSIDDVNEVLSNSRISKKELNKIYEALGGFPIAVKLFSEYICEYEIGKVDISELINLTREEKNKWIFEKIYNALSDEEKEVLKYISSIEYGIAQHEIIIIEKDLKKKIKYILNLLNSKSIVLYDGSVYYLHDVIRELAYDMLFDETKIYIHTLLADTYEKRLFNYNNSKKNDDDFLSVKWGYHEYELYKLNSLEDSELIYVFELSKQQRFDIFGIWWCGYPYEFEKEKFCLIDKRINNLVKKGLILEDGIFFKLSESISLKALYMIEYLVKKEFDAIAQGYIPIILPNLAYNKQRKTACEWEHCIEYMFLREERDEYSCPVFGHDCPAGKEQVEICAPNKNKIMKFLMG